MTQRPTPRQAAREANITRIKELALNQLAIEGPGGLSLRAIARDLNLVSSAIYRYYASRDDLITDLVVDAYADLAEHVTGSCGQAEDTPPRERWVAGCMAFRAWAVEQPHRYALVYGSAIPGYVAPQTTVAPAARVVRALLAPVAEGLRVPGSVPDDLAPQLRATAEGLELPTDPAATLELVAAFARIQGAVGLELNGHFVGGFEPADLLFETLVRADAERWNLT